MSKLSFCILCIICLSLSSLIARESKAQVKSVKEVQIDINLNQVSLFKALKMIEDRTSFNFVLSKEKINLNQKVDLDINRGTVEEALLDLSRQAGVSFKQINENIDVRHLDKRKKDLAVEILRDKTIVGKVTDENGNGLPGVNVLVKDTSIGIVTDIEGNYKLNVPDDATTLVFSYVGYLTEEVDITGRTTVDFVLTPDVETLSEVVVVGYGTQAKKDVTGAITSIGSETIEQRPVTSVDNVLQGLAPGLNVGARDNAPGQLSRITVRSIGSLSAGYEPLWVIDGFPTDQRNAQSINPADIQSIEILKDASSTAIYGSRGANGVIIITTKKGKQGDARFDVSVNTGFSSVPESARYDVLNAQEYVQYHTEANGGVTPDFITNFWDGQTDTDWQDELLKTGTFQNYSISASGGTEKVTYLLSGNYTDQSGVISGQGFTKYSARMNLEYHPSDRITFSLSLAPNYSIVSASDNTEVNGLAGLFSSAYSQAVQLAPIIPVRRNDGSFSVGADMTGFNPLGNPLETVQRYKSTQDIFRFLGGMNLAIEPIEGLILKSSISTNLGSDSFERLYNAPNDGITRNGYPVVSTLGLAKQQQVGWLNENIVTYKRQIGQDHAFDILGGFTLQKDQFEALGANVSELQVQGPIILSLGNSETLTSFNSLSENTLVSLLGRANYSFKERYLLTATVRRDGSSRFGANNRNQTFGSFALGWRLSKEPFIQDLGFVDNAKLRVSYGSTGSNAIPNFIARPSLNPVNQAFGSAQVTGIRISSPGNPGLTWETSKQLNIGLDLTLFDDKFNIVLDYYNNETTSLLLSRNLVASSGFTGFLTNIGSMRNKGIELAANVNLIENSEFSWSVGGNVTKNDQEILDLGGDDEIRNFFGALRRTVGGELQNIHVTRAVGILREGQTLPDGVFAASATPQPGDIIYEDVDGNGAISNFLGPDGQNLEGTNLDWVFGFNTKVRYKGFELSALFQGQSGGYILDLYNIQIGAPSAAPGAPNLNFSKEYWYDGRYISESQPGDGRTPAAGRFNDGISTVSSLGNQKTDYLRFKNITLTYSIPETLLSKIGIMNATIFTSIENVKTWTDFIGVNPDLRFISNGGPSLFGGSRIPGVSDGRELGLTIGVGNPLPRIWTFGVNFSF
ncbi:TonB-dependent receptor [Splendidivirga corallicola]|uniref:TonB-dependent receptor n=1 Tax=Splendidivirga corallicola TaxID=3051826 RepID=UPI003211C390